MPSIQPTGAGPSGLSRFVDWWVAELAGPNPAAGPKTWRAVFFGSGQSLSVYLRQGSQSVHVGTLPLDAPDANWQAVASKLKRSGVSRGSVVLRLAETEVVYKRLPLPFGVREVLRAVVANQIESVAPFHADQAMFDCREAATSDDKKQIEVDVWVASRARVERWLALLARHGLEPSAVDVGTGPEKGHGINLISNAHDTALRRARMRQRLGAGLTLMVCLSALSFGWLAYRNHVSSNLERQARQALEAAKLVGQTDLDSRRKAAAGAVAKRMEQPVLAIVLEALSRVLPDSASLERLEVREGNMVVSGKTADAPSLIALIEASPHFKNVEFAAPTTRDETTNKSVFSISAKIMPHVIVDPK